MSSSLCGDPVLRRLLRIKNQSFRALSFSSEHYDDPMALTQFSHHQPLCRESNGYQKTLTLFTRVKIPIYAVRLLLLMLTRMSLHTQEQFNFFTVTLFNCSVREYCLKIWTSPRSWLHATIKQCGHQWLKMLQSSWHTGVYFHNCVKPLQIDRLVQKRRNSHYNDAIMGTMASQITSLTSVYSTVYSGANQRKHQSSVSLAFVLGIHRGPVNSPHKWPVTRKMFPFDDVIMSGLAMELRLSCTYPSKWKLNSMTLFALVEKHGTEPKRLPYQEWPSIYWCK